MRDGALVASDCYTRLGGLKAWLAANDVRLSPGLEIRSVPSDACPVRPILADGGDDCSYGIFAKADYSAGDILAVIPKDAILSRRTCALSRSSLFQRLCDDIAEETPQQAGVRVLTVAVANEILLEHSSRWYGYLKSMPRAPFRDLPTFWEDDETLDWMANTDISACLAEQRCAPADLAWFLDTHALPFLRNCFPQVSHDTLSHACRLSFSLVLSRAFYVDNYHDLSLVPLADVFNHHFESQAILQTDDIVCPTCGSSDECQHDLSASVDSRPRPQAGSSHSFPEDYAVVEMVATCDGYAGVEVFNTYGKLDNARLLVNYGFVLDANEDDKVRWHHASLVLEQTGIPDRFRHDAVKQWHIELKDNRMVTPADLENCISDELVQAAHVHKDGDLLFIDADGNVSYYLWRLVLLSLHVAVSGEVGSRTATLASGIARQEAISHIVALCRARLASLKGASTPVDELFDLAQGETRLSLQLAIQRNIDERLLLETCIAKWSEEDSTEL